MKKIVSLALATLLLAASLFCFASCGEDSKVKLVDIKLTEEEYAFAVAKGDDALLSSVNDLLDEMKADGSFDAIVNRYFGDGTPVGYEGVDADPNKENLVVATNAAFAPFEYMEGNKYYGIDIEIMAALAEKLDKELVISNMDFDATISSVEAGHADIVAAGLTYRPDRAEIVNFSKTYYKASQMVIVLEDDTTFDNCETVADVEKVLAELPAGTKVGAQNGTTGKMYLEGDEEMEFAGFSNLTVKGYSSAALAVQDMINGNLSLVVVDEGPAGMIVKSLNED